MPLVNSKKNNYADAKYTVFISKGIDKLSDWKKSRRLIPVNSRIQSGSLGSAAFTMIMDSQFPIAYQSDVTESPEDIKVGYFVGICLSELEPEATPGSAAKFLFLGKIVGVNTDTTVSKKDGVGYVEAEEVGFLYTKTPLSYNAEPTIFNPIVGNEWIGNKRKDTDEEDARFRTKDFARMKVDNSKEWPESEKNKVWTREEVIKKLCGVAAPKTLYPVTFPWEKDQAEIDKKLKSDIDEVLAKYKKPADKEKRDEEINTLKGLAEINKKNAHDAYKFFLDFKEPRSYDAYYNRPLYDALNDLIGDKFEWEIDYHTSDSWGLIIKNKAPIALPNTCPAAKLKDIVIDKDCTVLSIVETQEVPQKITVIGDNILWCGTVSTNRPYQVESLHLDWSVDEEKAYLKGGKTVQTNEPKAKSFRTTYVPSVYQSFKWKTTDDKFPVQVLTSNYPIWNTQFSEPTRVPFFGRIDWITDKLGNYTGPENYTIGDGVTKKGTAETYKDDGTYQPNLSDIRWADTLPFSKDGSYLQHIKAIRDSSNPTGFPSITGSNNIELATPFFMYKYILPTGKCAFRTNYDSGPCDTHAFQFTLDGIKVNSVYPEVFACSNDLLRTDSVGAIRSTVDDKLEHSIFLQQGWKDPAYAGASARNPDLGNYGFPSHYTCLYFTIAGFSKQKMKFSYSNPKITNGVEYIIEDPSLQFWFAHEGTFVGMQNTVADQKLETEPLTLASSKVFRNDADKALKQLEFAKVFLGNEKKSIRLQIHLMAYNLDLKIGDMIGKVKDGDVTYGVNSAVSSIEYDFNPMNPRVIISTNIPDMPILKNIKGDGLRIGTTPLMSDLGKSGKGTIKSEAIQSNKNVAGITQATNIPDEKVNAWIVRKGQQIPPTNILGIKKVTTQPTATTDMSAGNYTLATYPDGIGVIQNLESGEYSYGINYSAMSLFPYDCWSGQIVTTGSTIALSGNGFTVGAKPIIWSR